jgi:hypothetical protein
VLSLRKLACTLLVVIILLSFLLLVENVSADTFVYGTISQNTTWTTVNSPYTLTANVLVNTGVTLTIQPGVTVKLGSWELQVLGTLTAQGTSSNKIYFSSAGNPQEELNFGSSEYSSVVDNAVFSSVPVYVDDSSPTVNDSTFSGVYNSAVITVNLGSPVISNNVIAISNSEDDIAIYDGSPAITSNVITGGLYGIYTAGELATIMNNNISNCYSGVYSVGQSIIEENIITNNTNDGIVTNQTGSTIQYNTLAYNTCGVSGDGDIVNNTIAYNVYGLYGQTGLSTINYNNIVSNNQNVHLTQNGANVEAILNWWGTTDVSTINQTISDYKDYSNLGTVTFTPFLTQFNVFAPPLSFSNLVSTLTPSPLSTATPAPTPTFLSSPPITPTPTRIYEPTPLVPTLKPSQDSTPSPKSLLGSFSDSDIGKVTIILLAIALSSAIIIIINEKFGQTQVPKKQINEGRRKSQSDQKKN